MKNETFLYLDVQALSANYSVTGLLKALCEKQQSREEDEKHSHSSVREEILQILPPDTLLSFHCIVKNTIPTPSMKSKRYRAKITSQQGTGGGGSATLVLNSY